MEKEMLKIILENHIKWLNDLSNGLKADLRGADLREADLRWANLRDADLCEADLRKADLRGADLRGADLRWANLRGANLRGANLCRANLCGANLCRANLCGANLREVDLIGANLREADYDISTIGLTNLCPTGSFIGWKKGNNNTLIKLKILAKSKRSNATSLKCRCSAAKVLEITKIDTNKKLQETYSIHDNNFKYEVGKIVKVDNFDDDRWNECSSGIHFFIDKETAIKY